MYTDRINQLDLKVQKTFQLRRVRISPVFEIFNVTNSDAIVSYVSTNALATTYLRPNSLLQGRLIGIGATAVTDLWSIVRRVAFRVPFPHFGMVGRWFVHLARGRFRHESIAAATAVRHEHLIGWTAHYLIGIAFAALLVAIWGVSWIHQPTLAPALIVGLGTVAFPFLLMQPGMGAGIAASRAPNPTTARIQSLVTHGVFGLGLYVAALTVRALASLVGG